MKPFPSRLALLDRAVAPTCPCQLFSLVLLSAMSSPHDNDTPVTDDQLGVSQVREARQFHQLLSGAEEAARGDLWEIVETLTRQVEELRTSNSASGSSSRKIGSEVRWLDARVMLLEQALVDSRTEVSTLRDYIDAYGREMQLDIQDAAARAKAERQLLIDEIRDLLAANAELEHVLGQLRAESSDRIEGVAAELFEVADQTRHIATDAHLAANAVAEHADDGARARAIAEEARAAALQNTLSVAEVRDTAEDAHVAARLSIEATEGVFAIAEEARAAAEENTQNIVEVREVAGENTQNIVEVREVAEENQEAVAESKEEAEEIRVMTEKAKDLAERSANDVSALQADSDKRKELLDLDLTEISAEVTRLKVDLETASKDLQSGWQQISSDVDSRVEAATNEVSQQLRAEVDASTEAMHLDLREEATSLREETSVLRAKIDEYSDGSGGSNTQIEDLRLQLAELRGRMESISTRSDRQDGGEDTTERSTKRWVAHLDLSSQRPELRGLPSPEGEDTRS